MSAYAFPEADYPPAPEHAAAYAARLELGRERAAASRVAICGLARQLGEQLPIALAAIEAIGGLFGDYRAYVIENDSTDGTAAGLQAWAAANPRAWCRCERLQQPHWPAVRDGRRGAQLALARNKYLDAVRASEAAAFEHALVLDLDIGRYSLDGVLAALGTDVPWDALCANGIARWRGRIITYDAWAHRRYGCLDALPAREVNPLTLRRGEPPYRVSSSFGGLALYRMPAFLKGRYAGGDCEHVPYHAVLEYVWIVPDLLVLYPDVP